MSANTTDGKMTSYRWQWLAVHFAPSGVRVNAIAPGFLLTNQNRFLLTDEQTREMTPRGRKIIAATPMGRYAEPE